MFRITNDEMLASVGGGLSAIGWDTIYSAGGGGSSFSPGNISHDNYSYTGNADYSAANCRGAVTSYAASGTFFGSGIANVAGTIAGFLLGGPPGAIQGGKIGGTFGATLGFAAGGRVAAKSKYCSFYD